MEKLRRLDNGEYELELEFTQEEIDDITKRAEAEGLTFNDYVVKMATAPDGPKAKLMELLKKTAQMMQEAYNKNNIDKETYDKFTAESNQIEEEINK